MNLKIIPGSGIVIYIYVVDMYSLYTQTHTKLLSFCEVQAVFELPVLCRSFSCSSIVGLCHMHTWTFVNIYKLQFFLVKNFKY